MNLKKFKQLLAQNKCPFCEEELEYHDGLLGYASYNCYQCGLEIDHNGMRLLTPHKEIKRKK